MPDFREQLRKHYDAMALPAEKVEAILERGRATASGAADPVKKVVRFPRRAVWTWALAASLALCAGLTLWWPGTEPVPFAVLAPRVVEFFGTPPELPKRSQNPEELRAWLLAQGAPRDFQLPAKLRTLESLGCQVVDVKGHPAYLTCFWAEKKSDTDEGALVHLWIVHHNHFRDGPVSATPEFRELAGWSFASWGEGGAIYTIAAAASLEKLRRFVVPREVSPIRLARL